MSIKLGRLGSDGVGGGGGASVGALLRQSDDNTLGLFIKYAQADESWHLRGVERQTEEAASAATAEYEAGTARMKLTFGASPRYTFRPRGDFVHNPEQINTYDLNHNQYPAPTPAVKAKYEFGDLVMTATQADAAGNANTFEGVPGTAATDPVNAYADIPLSTGAIRVRSPNAASASATAEALPSGDIHILCTYHTAGTAGNGFTIDFEYDSAVVIGRASAAVVRTGGAVTGIRVGIKGVVSRAAIATAINGVMVDSTQLVTAAEVGSSSSTIAFIADGSADTSAVLRGGVNGTGTDTNRGNVRTIRGADRTGSAGATAKYEGSTTPGFFTLSWFEPGTEGNGFKILRRTSATNLPTGFDVFYEDNGGTFEDLVLAKDADVAQSLDVATFITAVNAARDSSNRQLIVATGSPGTGTLASFFPGSGNADIERTLSGGAAGTLTNPLTVSYAPGTNVLRVTGLPTDTGEAVITAVAKRANFQTGNGSNPGDVWYVNGGSDTATLTVPSLMNQSFRNNFANGVDAVARTVLRWLTFRANSGVFNLTLDGYISGDTVQNAIDARVEGLGRSPLTDLSTILSSKSNDTTTALLTRAQAEANFTGGKNLATRQLPRVSQRFRDETTAGYDLRYHGSDTPSGQRTTLAEMKAAWEANFGNNFGHPTVVITGAGTSRISAVPSMPTGGSDYVPPSPAEVLVRPNDQVNGPNIEVRYHADNDTLAEILAATSNNDAGVQVVEVYGTDNTANPESPGFARGLR